MEVPTPSVQD